jgi:hypothetical protein
MFMGWPISLAFFSAALITRRASSNFTADMSPPYDGFQSAYRMECRQARRLAALEEIGKGFSAAVSSLKNSLHFQVT